MILLFPQLLSLPVAVSVQALYDVVRPFEPGRRYFPYTSSSLDAFALARRVPRVRAWAAGG